jgi:hypothetical protein
LACDRVEIQRTIESFVQNGELVVLNKRDRAAADQAAADHATDFDPPRMKYFSDF